MGKDLDQPIRQQAQNQAHPHAISQSHQELSRLMVLAFDKCGVLFLRHRPFERVVGESWHRLHVESLGQGAARLVNIR